MKTNRVRTSALWMIIATGLLLAMPVEGMAQARVGISVEWWDWIGDVRVHGSVDYGTTRHRPIYRDHGYVRPPRPVYERRPRHREERGPPFCRSGAGHPVHGWQWCVRKGFARAHSPRTRRYRRPVHCCTWHPVDLGRVRFRARPGGHGPQYLRHEEVVEILGRVVVERVYAGVGYPREMKLQGRWYPAPGHARVLQLRAGSTPLAELTDLDDDRRVDRVFLARTERVNR